MTPFPSQQEFYQNILKIEEFMDNFFTSWRSDHSILIRLKAMQGMAMIIIFWTDKH